MRGQESRAGCNDGKLHRRVKVPDANDPFRRLTPPALPRRMIKDKPETGYCSAHRAGDVFWRVISQRHRQEDRLNRVPCQDVRQAFGCDPVPEQREDECSPYQRWRWTFAEHVKAVEAAEAMP